MFCEQFHLSVEQKNGLEEFNVFIVTVYIKKWFIAGLGTCAPNNDLQLVKT